jgi:hypothetical protein
MKIYSLEEVKQALEDRNIRLVAQRVGVHEQTLYNIAWGKSGMSRQTYEKLVPYLFGSNETSQKVD